MKNFNEFMEWLFWRVLCPKPDKATLEWLLGHNRGMKLTNWLYNFTRRISDFFHKKNCRMCRYN